MKGCRVCGAALHPYADLGEQPLANALDGPEDRYPLVLAHCNQCWLSQLTVAVDPTILYRDYHYASGVSAQWVRHCEQLAKELNVRRRFVVEIASNDGTLLRLLKAEGASVLGVEPAANLVRTYPKDIPHLPEFFTEGTARWIATRYGHADCVIAQNVIGHVDDIKRFLHAVRRILNRKRGLVVLEAPYLYRMLATREFPQVYHEHLSYWSLYPLQRVAETVGLEVVHVQPISVHGGSMRYFLKHEGNPAHPSVGDLLQREAELQSDPDLYTRFDPKPLIAQFETALESYRGKKVWGYGASAKATVLLNTLKNADIISAVVDDYAGKQGRYIPGVKIPIVPPQDLSDVDCIVVLAWNWGDAIEHRAESLGFGAKEGAEFLTTGFTPQRAKGRLRRIA